MEGFATYLLPGAERVTITVRFETPAGVDTTMAHMQVAGTLALHKFLRDAQVSYSFKEVPKDKEEEMVEEPVPQQ